MHSFSVLSLSVDGSKYSESQIRFIPDLPANPDKAPQWLSEEKP